MGNDQAEAKSENVSVRVTPTEKVLLDDLAFVRGTTRDALIREHGVDRAVEISRRVRSRFAESA